MELDFAAPSDDGPPLRIRVDPSLIEQILFNLIDNACKYAGPDAADYQRPRQIHLEGIQLPRNRIGLRVRDHGPGLSPDVRLRLFEPFSKSAEQAAHSAPGVGLGLSLCRQLARSQGGDLVLETSGPSGTTFRLEFPSAPFGGTAG